jgi:peptidoglycan hydrolase-like protein with peptidoglycan-binding domain
VKKTAVVALLPILALVVWYVHQRADRPASPAAAPLPTKPVLRGDLVASLQLTGQLGYLGSRAVVGQRAGTVTAVPAVGSVVERGAQAYAVDQRPIPLLFGGVPLYRSLGTGSTGGDVRLVEENLVALGHGRGVIVDDRYTAGTAEAVRRWQRAYGVPATGRIEPGDAVVAPGPLRVVAVRPLVGQPTAPGEVVLTGTGTAAGVQLQVQLANRAYLRPNQDVQVRLPGGRSVPGRVASIGGAAQSESCNGGATAGNGGSANCPQTVPVEVAVQGPTGDVTEGTVSVTFPAASRRGVLSVPVEALVPDAEGGFAVVLVDGGGRRTVPVTTGLFTAGRVEVTGPGIVEGAQVEVPST